MKKIITVSLIIFLTFTSMYSQTPEKKDPFIAGVLSFSMLGAGQFYAKEYTKGSLFVLIDLIQKASLIWLTSRFTDKYTDEEKGDQIVEWQEMSKEDRILVIGYIIFHGCSKIFCVYDAVKCVEKYNRRLLKMKKESFSFSITHDNINHLALKLGWSYRF